MIKYHDFKFKDTDQFNLASRYFMDHGVYTKHPEGSFQRTRYWDEQEYRSLYGMTSNGIYIPGYFYWYLNFSPIMIARETDIELINVVENDDTEFIVNHDEDRLAVTGERIDGFPDFWDWDYDYYIYLDECEKAPAFAVVLKARGQGYSFKGGSMLTRNYFLIPKSVSYATADDKSYLTNDGILSKAWDIMDFVDEYTDFAKRRQYKNTELIRKSSFERNIEGRKIESGFKSQIIGITTNENPNKVRGVRGKLALHEESGSDPNLVKKWRIMTSSLKQGRIVYGLQCAFGTGGDKEADFRGISELFYHPKSYFILPKPNIFEKGHETQEVGFFVPRFANYEGYMDKDGNSDCEGAIALELRNREIIKTESGDVSSYNQYIAENPFSPSEAILASANNIFDAKTLTVQRDLVLHDSTFKYYVQHGKLLRNGEGRVTFDETDKVQPLNTWESDPRQDNSGCISVVERPYMVNNKVPDGLYLIGHDPYGQDQSTGPSIGSAYVYKKPNPFSPFMMDNIVAWYNGRPKTQDDYNSNLFMLSEYYNAKIGFENDRGEVIPYAKRIKKLHYLAGEFEMLYNKELPRLNIRRGYGMKMGSGKNSPIKNQGLLYLRDWLMQERAEDDTGKIVYNYQMVFDPGLLDELINFNLNSGNFDRIMGMVVLMYHMYEKFHATVQAAVEEDKESFFNRTDTWFTND